MSADPAAPAPAAALALRFRRFAERECRGISPLYERLALAVAADARLLALAAEAPPAQPAPNLLFAAVHALLLDGAVHPLRECYPDLVPQAGPPAAAAAPFADFCLRQRGAIAARMRSRRVATNEAGRAAVLYPGLLLAGRAMGGGTLNLVDIGASAGLTLPVDRYRYDYGPRGGRHGPCVAPLTLHCALRGGRPPLHLPRPRVGRRIGLDLAPLDVRSESDARWLRALVWPEQRMRAQRLDKAVAAARRAPPVLLAGEATRLLPRVLAGLPAGEAVCVVHAFTLNQFDAAARRRLQAVLRRAARRRPVCRLGFEWGAGAAPALHLAVHAGDGAVRGRWLARADAHGAWLDWRCARRAPG